MRPGPWLIALALAALLPLSGCAKLNEWLEGSVDEEEKAEGPTPEEQRDTAIADLAGTDAAKRKAAIGTLLGLKRDDCVPVVIAHIDDADQAVSKAVLSGLQTVTGFPEKTEDEKQLDPEGYEQQLTFKQMVVEQGSEKLAKVLKGSDDVRYGALIVFYNLGLAPVVPETAKADLAQKVAGDIGSLALDATAPSDARLLAIDTLVSYEAGEQIPKLAALLTDEDPAVRARAALAIGQGTRFAADWPANTEADLLKLAGARDEPLDVRRQAALALGRLASPQAANLALPLSDDEAIDAYRTYALAHSTSPEAVTEVAELNKAMDQEALAAEEELAIERKKGYH